MGYYTKYELGASKSFDAVHDALKDISGYTSGPFEDACKWYMHENDCKAVSKMYPDVVISLYGEGEESGDIWKKYFLNGKMQICKADIVFPVFDKSKLE